jgi:hypothetical protein
MGKACKGEGDFDMTFLPCPPLQSGTHPPNQQFNLPLQPTALCPWASCLLLGATSKSVGQGRTRGHGGHDDKRTMMTSIIMMHDEYDEMMIMIMIMMVPMRLMMMMTATITV